MANAHPSYAKKQIAIDSVSWTAIVAPIDCNGIGIKNSQSVDLRIRTDSADPATQDLIPAGNQDGIMVGQHPGRVQEDGRATRFMAGETIAFLQAISGTGPALCTFVR